MFRRLLRAALGLVALSASAADGSLPRHADVVIAPAKTSIYLGTVLLTMPAFARKAGAYESSYVAKVFPFFFANERGRLRIEIADELLGKLERGETIAFKGSSVRDDGTERRIEGTATPTDAANGSLKVHVFVSKRIELIFNTTYRFGR